VKSVANDDFESLQRTVERGADLGVSDIEAESGGMIAVGGGKVGGEPLCGEGSF
jgi:hypothetical protein